MVDKADVNEGDYFILSPSKGYSGNRRAMQVMEKYNTVMTVKTEGGCITKGYDHFDKVTDLANMREIHSFPYFEDNTKN